MAVFNIIIVGFTMVMICLFALIPPFAQIVMPFIDWLKSPSIFNRGIGDSMVIITILATLGVSAIPCGVALVKPSYKELKKKYSKKDYANLPSTQA